jgi:peptide/nickel transport system ATP-binding protein
MPLLEADSRGMNSPSPTEPLIAIKDLKKWYPVRKRFLSRAKNEFVHAVDGVNLDIRKGEALSLVGESGCGKTTLARLMLRLVDPTEGTITLRGQDLLTANKREMHRIRTQMQAVFQDPYASLDPKQTILQIVSEPLMVNKLDKKHSDTLDRVTAALTAVGLNPPKSFLGKLPYELSGGQRQRVALARAIVINPSLIVADEPVSMLDVSIRAEILGLMLKLKRELNLTYLFITHDLAVARYISDRMAVMYLGRVVEVGPAEEVCRNPVHPYTKALLLALPTTDPRKRSVEIGIKGEVPSPVNIPEGCRFKPRCPYAFEKCAVEPELLRAGNHHYAACYLAESPS